MKISEFRRWLKAQGATILPGTKHDKIYFNGRQVHIAASQRGAGRRPAQSDPEAVGGEMMFYPARIERDGRGWMVAFPDIPEALTGGATKEEALDMARDALTTALEFYFDEKRSIPTPSRLKRGQVAVELPASIAAKVLLLNEMIEQHVRPADLARRMGTSAQEVHRLTQLRHATKIDGIDQALHALGKRLEIRAV